MKLTATAAATVFAFALLTSLSQAATTVIAPNSISFTGTATELGGLNLDIEDNLINGNGLLTVPTFANLSTVTHADVSFSAPGNAWTTTDPGGFPSSFFAATAATVVFEMTFDQTYEIKDLVSWGYHFGTLNGNDISEVEFEYGVGNFANTTGLISVALAGAAGDAVVTDLGGTIVADQLRMTVTANHFGNATGGDRVGLAEIRFIAIPEPSSTLLLGFAGLFLA